MRNRLVIATALAVLVAVLGAGAGSASSGSAVSVDLPGGGSAGVALPACANSADDDGDGLIDLADPGCENALDGDEVDPDATAPPPTTTTTPEPPTTTPEPATPPESGGDGPGTEGGGGEKGASGGERPTEFGPGEEGGKGGKGGGKDEPDGKGEKDGPEHSFGGDDVEDEGEGDAPAPIETPEIRRPDGTPTAHNPTVTIGDIGAAPVGVPNFIIDQFSIPPFLLPIYQACGTQYGVPWEVLASINRIETAFGTNLNVSTAGALGWMQFMPSSWAMYGVDANDDGKKDPYNPVDAICAAARYLKAAGAQDNLYDAIFAYNHADWYVDEVLLYAKQYGNLPSVLVDSLTGLTEGAHFPVAAKARYADDISERKAARRASGGGGSGNVADVISDSPTRRGIDIYAEQGAPVVAVNDGVIKKVGESKKLGKFIVLRDAYGNEFTYAELGEISDVVPVPKERKLKGDDFDLITPGAGDKPPKVEASETTRDEAGDVESDPLGDDGDGDRSTPDVAASGPDTGPTNTEDSRDRIFANPDRPNTRERADGGDEQGPGKGTPGYETFKSYFSGVLRFDDSKMDTEPLREGSHVVAGTILGRIGAGDDQAPHLNFAITPAGRGSHTIDPKPILDGWKLLEATAIYRAAGKNPFDDQATVGQVLLASKSQLQRQVLNDPNIEIYSCGREDIASGQIDRRILATLEYLVQRGFRLTITSLKCGHSIMTTSGNVSAHSTGDAVDIAQVNGIPIFGHQGKGSITEAVIKELLKLQGPMQPAQIISLMEMGGPTFAMGDHDDHIHVGFTPDSRGGGGSPLKESLLSPGQWDKLLDRIGELDQPDVPTKPSDAALPAGKGGRASHAHVGE